MIPEKIKILVADDHAMVREGIIALLSLNKDFEVVGQAPDGRGAVEMALEKDPDVVLLDISMPGLNGLDATRQIRKQAPHIKILLLSGYDNEAYVREGIHCGADGYLLKNSSPQDLQAAIKAVHCNHAFFSPAVSRIIIDDYNKRGISLAVSVDEHSAIPNRLTAREREILQLIAGGKTHQEIAEVLHISVRTVDTHRNNIIQKLDLHSTASLVTYAIKNGIVILPM